MYNILKCLIALMNPCLTVVLIFENKKTAAYKAAAS